MRVAGAAVGRAGRLSDHTYGRNVLSMTGGPIHSLPDRKTRHPQCRSDRVFSHLNGFL